MPSRAPCYLQERRLECRLFLPYCSSNIFEPFCHYQSELFLLTSRWPNLYVPRSSARHSRSQAGRSNLAPAYELSLTMPQIHRLTAGGNGRFRTGLVRNPLRQIRNSLANWLTSSAKDQLTGQAVAVKKIMKPFSTPVLSKRTYRELKLLKHLRHENV